MISWEDPIVSEGAARIIEISDPADPRLDDYRAIRDRELRGPEAFGGLFVGEQALVVERMLQRPGLTRSVLVTPRRLERVAPKVPPDVPAYVPPLPIMEQLAGFNIHRGVLALGYRAAVERSRLEIPPPDRPVTLVLCEEVSNLDNIGFVFRNAAAFGADGVLLSPGTHDPLYRKSLRVSIGHALTVPFARSEDWHADLERLRGEHELTIIAASADKGAPDLETLPRPRRVALLVGAEFEGVSPKTLDFCDHVARIRMAPGVDSLNVAVAAAVFLHRFSNADRQ
jgi:tRNA G18 (ribose-2'-O)-methylase SpoU